MPNNLLKSTATVGSMTLVSRILGFLRDIILANIFGASLGYDAFLTAFKIPNFMRRLFAEGAFSQAFVPVLAEYKVNNEQAKVREFLSNVFGTLAIILSIICLLGMVFSPGFILLFAPGFYHDEARFVLASDMLRITFPYLLLISLTAFYGAVLNSYNKFIVPAITPVLLNLSLIFAAMYLANQFNLGIKALAWGVFLGGVLQFLFQLPFLKRQNLLPSFKFNLSHPGVKKILKLMLPAILGVSITQINLMVDTIFASFLPVGSLSWLYYADRMLEFPVGVFGVALATVVLPNLSRNYQQAKEQYAKTLNWALKLVVVIAIPAQLALTILSEAIITTLFKHGKFTSMDVVMASSALKAYSFGLLAFILIKVLAPAFYARQNIKTPVKVAIVAMLANIICNALLVGPMGHTGLALATAISALINAGLLLVLILKNKFFSFGKEWLSYLSRVGLSLAIMMIVLKLLTPDLNIWLELSTLARAKQLALVIISGAGSYFLALYLSGLRLRNFVLQVAE